MKKEWKEVAFTEIAALRRREVTVEENGAYPEVGVRCFGSGLFHKAPRSGLEVGDKRLFRLKCGDLIIQVTFAWEGAVALVASEDESFFGSVRVLTFEVNAEKCDVRFLLWYFKTKQGVEQLARISPGSAGRNRVLAIGRLDEIVVPLPPLAEQQRLVGHLGAIEGRLTHAQELRKEQEQKLQAALRSAFHSLEAQAEWLPLFEVAPMVRREVAVHPEGAYPELGIRSFGRGTFHKPNVIGIETTKRLFAIHAGDLVFNNVFAWEGAVAVAQPEDHGRVGSHRFISCVCDPARAMPEFLQFYFLTRDGLEKLGKASPGGAGRNRTLGIERLSEVKVPVVSLAEQSEFKKLIDLQTNLRGVAAQSAQRTAALLPSLLDCIFNS